MEAPYSTPTEVLSDAECDRIKRLNAKNGYGLNKSTLERLIREHKKARTNNDIHGMALVEYRLTDINFHHECGLLSSGQYEQALKELKEF